MLMNYLSESTLFTLPDEFYDVTLLRFKGHITV